MQENALQVGKVFLERLKDLKQKYQEIGDVRGKGLMLAIEIVKSRKTKEPDPDLTSYIFDQTREQGIIVSKSDIKFFSSSINNCPICETSNKPASFLV